MGDEVNSKVELWRDPQSGVVMPFIDIRLVVGRVDLPDRVFTYLNGEMDGRPCVIQLAYWRWAGAQGWGDPTPQALSPLQGEGEKHPDERLSWEPPPWSPDFEDDDLMDFPHGIDYDTTAYAPSPIFVRRGRPISSQIVETAVVVWGLTLTLCGIVAALNWLWRLLRGG